MTRTAGQPRILGPNNAVRIPEPIPVTSELIDEAYIQKLLDEHPALIPLDEIGPSWGPLISLGREVPTAAGPIDNIFVSTNGEITIVEAKLWRNPESRRKVVAQLLDYASAVAGLSYDEFEAVTVGGSLWDHVQASGLAAKVDEAQFVDAVSRSLERGAFLLLIVGDGIREDVQNLTSLLGTQPQLGFHLELVELRLYDLGDDEVLVVPSIVGATREVTRAVVEVRTSVGGDVTVNVEALAEEPERSRAKQFIGSMDEFLELAEAATDQDWARHCAELAEWWVNECGGVTRLNETSLSLWKPYRHHQSGNLPVLVLYLSGTAELSNLHLARMTTIFDEAALDTELRSQGLAGKKRLTYRHGHSTGAVQDVLRSIVERIDAANQLEEPPA